MAVPDMPSAPDDDFAPAVGRAFDWTDPGVLWGHVLSPGASTVGGAVPAAHDLLPMWTLNTNSFGARPTDLPSLERRIGGLLGGRIEDRAEWQGTFTLALRVLSVLDALAVSCTVEMPPNLALPRALLRMAPAPGGSLDTLLDLCWHGACALFSRAASFHSYSTSSSYDDADFLRRFSLELKSIAPIPVWSLERWSGRWTDPPRHADRASHGPLLVDGFRRPARLLNRFAARVLKLPDRHLNEPRPRLAAGPLLSYQLLSEEMLWCARIALRLAAHLRFRLEFHVACLDGTLSSSHRDSSRSALIRCLKWLDYLKDRFPYQYTGLLATAREVCDVNPAWLIQSELWLAFLWDLYAPQAVQQCWGIAPGSADFPDRVGPEVDRFS